jgi:hypothetical protein
MIFQQEGNLGRICMRIGILLMPIKSRSGSVLTWKFGSGSGSGSASKQCRSRPVVYFVKFLRIFCLDRTFGIGLFEYDYV